jgi:hypothetical protein
MRRVLLVVALAGCKKHEPAPPAPAPVPPAPKVAPAPPCDLAGSYRVRFESNDTKGWWLDFTIAAGKAQVTQPVPMFALAPGPVTLEATDCKGVISAQSNNAGKVELVFTLDPKTNTVTGTLTREKGGGTYGPAKQEVTGRRDVGGLGGPACLHAGVFKLVAGKAAWKLSEGEPSKGLGCNQDTAETTTRFVRIQPYGDELVVDEVTEGDPAWVQGDGRIPVKRLGDCALEIDLQLQDYDFKEKLTLAGDTITGTATDASFTFWEDGDGGENSWSCKATNVRILGTRVGD